MAKDINSKQAHIDRQIILDAALSLVLEHGVQNVSLRKIAAKIPCSAPTIYYHFRNKQEIISNLWENHLQKVLQDSLKHISLRDILNSYGQHWLLNRNLFSLIYINQQLEIEELPSYKKFQQVLVQKLEANHDQQRARQRSIILLSSIHGLLLSNVHNNFSLEESRQLLNQTIQLLISSDLF